MKRIARLSILPLFVAATMAQAQAVRTERNMSLELANQIASATIAACQANGYAVGVSACLNAIHAAHSDAAHLQPRPGKAG